LEYEKRKTRLKCNDEQNTKKDKQKKYFKGSKKKKINGEEQLTGKSFCFA